MKAKKHIVVILGLIAGQALFFQNCSKVRSDVMLSSKATDVQGLADPTGGGGGATPVLKSTAFDVSADVKTVDVLVVIDNSGSMAFEQKNMADRFDTFLDQLQGIDWRVAIITTDVSSDADLKDGRLLKMNGLAGDQYYLSSSMAISDAKAAFAATIQRPEKGDSNEQGIRATYRSLERYSDMSVSAVNDHLKGFYRSGAALSVVVVTDADETYKTLSDSNKPDMLISKVSQIFGSGKIFRYNSIIVKPGDSACAVSTAANQNEGYGYSYFNLSSLTNGVVGSVCDADYGSQLSALGKSTSAIVNNIKLACAPMDVNGDGKVDIQVSMNGAALSGYKIVGSEVEFDNKLAVGHYSASYYCAQ